MRSICCQREQLPFCCRQMISHSLPAEAFNYPQKRSTPCRCDLLLPGVIRPHCRQKRYTQLKRSHVCCRQGYYSYYQRNRFLAAESDLLPPCASYRKQCLPHVVVNDKGDGSLPKGLMQQVTSLLLPAEEISCQQRVSHPLLAGVIYRQQWISQLLPPRVIYR